jgi:hypothetical protein
MADFLQNCRPVLSKGECGSCSFVDFFCRIAFFVFVVAAILANGRKNLVAVPKA